MACSHILHHQRLKVSLSKKVVAGYRLGERTGVLSLVGSPPALSGVPVRRDYRKIALRGAVAFALMADFATLNWPLLIA
jgi:hypothetical protein